MYDPEYIEIEEPQGLIPELEAILPKLPKKDLKYANDLSKVISLLNAGTMVISPSGSKLDYLITDEDYRLELQGYAMSLLRNHLKSTIEVDQSGLKKKRTI